MDLLSDVFRGCGLRWTVLLFVSFTFPLVWRVGAFRRRCTRSVFLCLSFAPLLVGALGSVEAIVAIKDAVVASQHPTTPAEFAEGTRMTLMTTWVGLAGTASLLLIAAGERLFPHLAGKVRKAGPSYQAAVDCL
jgi:hypothetical protein